MLAYTPPFWTLTSQSACWPNALCTPHRPQPQSCAPRRHAPWCIGWADLHRYKSTALLIGASCCRGNRTCTFTSIRTKTAASVAYEHNTILDSISKLMQNRDCTRCQCITCTDCISAGQPGSSTACVARVSANTAKVHMLQQQECLE